MVSARGHIAPGEETPLRRELQAMTRLIVVLAGVLGGATAARSQPPEALEGPPLEEGPRRALARLTVERLAADPPLSGSIPSELSWGPDGRLSFLRPEGTTPARLVSVDPASGRETTLLEEGRATLPADAGPSAGRAIPLSGAVWLPRSDSVLVLTEGVLVVLDTRTGTARTLATDGVAHPGASPDGRRVAFVRRNDLYAVDIPSERETRLTFSGTSTLMNGRLDWVYEEELGSRIGRAFWWSPDSRSIAYLQLDEERVLPFPIVDFLPVRNEVRNQRYPKSGSPNAIVRLGIVSLEKTGEPGPERLVAPDEDDDYVVPAISWTPDSRSLAYQVLNRAQNFLDLRLLPVPPGASTTLGPSRTILSERSDTWVDTFLAPRFLKDGRRFLWISERDGFAHVVLCETANGTCRPVTKGPWLVDAAASFARKPPEIHVNERSGFVYFTATEKDPRERHLYRTRLDGTGLARLTREDGVHRTLPSPDGRFFADVWSDLATPPRVWLQSQDGSRRHVLDDSPSPLLDFERAASELVDLLAQDRTPLFGLLSKPPDFDPAKRYPVVVRVYGGPHAQSVTNSWTAVPPFSHLLASHGFLVFALDNRGTAGRGQAFETPIFRSLGEVELRDQLVGIDFLKSLPFVDPERIGIMGWSYGGFMALHATTHAPQVFRAAVAGAPVSDWSFYDTIYAERYMGTPAANPRGYEESAPWRKAHSLEASLLLIHGLADDNVHFASTVSFIDALTKAGKPYDLLLGPKEAHGFSSREARLARDRAILAHFARHLTP